MRFKDPLMIFTYTLCDEFQVPFDHSNIIHGTFCVDKSRQYIMRMDYDGTYRSLILMDGVVVLEGKYEDVCDF